MRQGFFVGKASSFFFIVLLSVLALGCAQNMSTTITINGFIPTYSAPEDDYCSNSITYGGAVFTITGAAEFEAREPFGVVNAGGLGAPGTPKPVRYAEVVVTNPSGTIVQCAETDSLGEFTFTLPAGTGNYKVSVNSRSDNNQLKAYVYDDPRYNNFYSLTVNFTPDSSKTLATLQALATGNVYGGAFNILDQFLNANDYLRAQVGNCSGTFASCDDFTVAPRVTAYWKLGFNPADYYGSGGGGLSFYLPGYSRLFILGGINDDIDNADTDHFDNSVILHEYGHFLEDSVFASDSPGGSHNGNKVIDPRLAWSEGWGNFFQAAVQDSPYYLDTEGNIDGSTDFAFYVDLEDQTRDVPIYDGEGNFREFSVTRLLWDAIDTNGDTVNAATDNISNAFIQIWYSLTSTSGWLRPSVAFRQIGHLHAYQGTLGTASWGNLHTIEKHEDSTADYAQYIYSGTTCTYSITPTSVGGDLGTFSTSHLLLNNDFYHIKIGSTTTATIILEYEDANNAGVKADLDFYLYRENARFGNGSDLIDYSQKTPTQNLPAAPASNGVETETLHATLAPGNYLLNVMVYTGSPPIGSIVDYTIKLNGSELCPTALP